MASLLDRLYFLPFSEARLRDELERMLRYRPIDAVQATLIENISHTTQKSGALLAAQAIFLVVDTFGIDHGWPRSTVIASTMALILSTLMILANLRSVYLDAPDHTDDPAELRRASLLPQARLTTLRAARFNCALYLTFLSVILMGIGALDAATGLR